MRQERQEGVGAVLVGENCRFDALALALLVLLFPLAPSSAPATAHIQTFTLADWSVRIAALFLLRKDANLTRLQNNFCSFHTRIAIILTSFDMPRMNSYITRVHQS
jgi:hypothetical protein